MIWRAPGTPTIRWNLTCRRHGPREIFGGFGAKCTCYPPVIYWLIGGLDA